ncbi:MAG: OmpA family protein [Rickettsiales bacterium]|nr:OmpA family protein [Rickettsiales bacterium]
MTFFILLFSMKAIPNTKWEELLKTFHSQFRLDDTPSFILHPTFKGIEQIYLEPALDIDYLYQLLLKQEKLKRFHLERNPEGIRISINSDIAFKHNSDQLTAQTDDDLYILSNVLNKIDNDIIVVIYSDQEGIVHKKYKAAWELSLARSIAITSALHRHGGILNANALSALDTLHHKNHTSITKEKIDNVARRVDIIIKDLESIQKIVD